MFVRKKTNRSGTVSVVVVSKAHGKFTEVKKFGVAKSEEEVEETKRFLSNIDNVLINGTQLLLDQVYDSIGFNQIPDEILRHLVIFLTYLTVIWVTH